MHPGIPVLEPVRDVEVDSDDRCDQEDAPADALMPGGVLHRLPDIEGLSSVHEGGEAQLGAAEHRRDWHAQLG